MERLLSYESTAKMNPFRERINLGPQDDFYAVVRFFIKDLIRMRKA
jgi:hypothetical protein